MNTVRLNPLDTAWIFTESRDTPNHVGGLLQFELPPDAPEDTLRALMADFRRHTTAYPPWNRRLKIPVKKNPVPSWVEDEDIDLDYHLRHSALPRPGGERELGELVARLHSQPLDLARPPWELTLIEGLTDRRFAMFVKIHHSLIDGVSGVKLLQRSMATDPARSLQQPPFWAVQPPRRAKAEDDGDGAGEATGLAAVASSAIDAALGQVRTLPQLIGAFARFVGRVGRSDDGLIAPFASPRSVLNGRVQAKRRFATQQFPLDRLRALAKAADGTLNDVVLAVCGAALRRFLAERDELPEASLTAGIPVSVRPADDEEAGNAITFIIASLGTDLADPLERLRAVQASVKHAKAHVQSLPRHAMQQYTVLLMAPTMLTMLTGVAGRTPPMFNITISNVPGPAEPLYFRGARLLGSWPASIVAHGQALNITCHSYAGMMDFGFTGCHASVPSLQHLAVYAAEALDELERALTGTPPKRKAAGQQASKPATKPAKRPAVKKAVKKAAKKSAREAARKAAPKAVKTAAGGPAAVRTSANQPAATKKATAKRTGAKKMPARKRAAA